MKSKLKPIDKKMLALVKIQAHFRRYLAVKKIEAIQKSNFRNKSNDPAKHLKLHKQGVFKQSGLFFMYFLYTDEYKEYVKVSIKEVSKKVTIINLKKIVLADFGD